MPEWMYECFGTMFFTMTMCSAWGAEGAFLHNSMAVGVSWALIHSVFNTHCKAHFNPLLTVGDFVKNKSADNSNFLDCLKNIFGQYVGCAFGIGLLERISTTTELSATAAKSGAQEYVMLFILAAFLVKFFWAEKGSKFWSESGNEAVWYAVAIAVTHMIGGSNTNSNMANPAVYTGAGVQNVIQSVVDGGEFDAFGFFSTQLLQNLAMYSGAVVSVLCTAWKYQGKGFLGPPNLTCK